jgi:hypothetical protein
MNMIDVWVPGDFAIPPILTTFIINGPIDVSLYICPGISTLRG